MLMHVVSTVALSLAAIGAGAAAPASKPADRPVGLAAGYPGDEGLDKDPAVLFAANFEDADLSIWDERNGPIEVTAERPHSGGKCVAMPMHRGKDQGGHLVKFFLPGAQQVYVRFYVRFSGDYQYPHHFVSLLASPEKARWRAFRKAGIKPDGTYFSSAMEPWFAWGRNPSPGEISFYSTFADMKADPKTKRYWGNAFFPPGPEKGAAAGKGRVVPPLDKWQCWEFMIAANSAPDKSDGEQAMWIDGRQVGKFTGLRWRTDMDTKINALWLQHYGYDSGDPAKEFWRDQQTAWFDDVVVATEYIGPVFGAAKDLPSAKPKPVRSN